MEKNILNWNSIELYSINLGAKIKSDLPYLNKESHCIVAVSKGGLIPARLLARELNTREIYSVGVSSYTSTNQKLADLTVYQHCNEPTLVRRMNSYQDIVLVDDIVDTGQTFKFLKNYWDQVIDQHIEGRRANIYTAALIYKPSDTSVEPPDFYDRYIDQKDIWVTFPWEENK